MRYLGTVFKFRTLKQLKSLLVRLSHVADGSAGQKKFFKVKYFSGAFPYGANIQHDAYIKNYIELRTLRLFCAYSWRQKTISYFTIVFVDFTLKNFSGLLHFTDFDRN
jgi:hypothetical protein